MLHYKISQCPQRVTKPSFKDIVNGIHDSQTKIFDQIITESIHLQFCDFSQFQ